MTDETRHYRHSVSGQTAWLHPRVASGDPHLVEVDADAKPLAFVPIPKEAVEALLAARSEDSDEGTDPVDEDEEN